MTPLESRRTLRTVATFEAAKGVMVILVGLGVFELVHQGTQHFAEALVAHMHLNPSSRYPRIFIDLFGDLAGSRGLLLASGAAAYALLRFVEAFGLWTLRSWGRIFGIASGAVYIPFEIIEVWRNTSAMAIAALTVNVLVVVALWFSRSDRRTVSSVMPADEHVGQEIR